ncbi:MAG TPA: DUF4261 domain-containing protein [Acidimicrobiales bacterium]|nr:DUF4261 domain-containing protein [Acidimicrobiales bacterium]
MLRRSKKRDGRGEQEQPTAGALAMPLLEAPRPLTTDALTAGWRSAWPEHTPPSDFDVETDEDGLAAMTFTIDGMRGALAVVPMPVPAAELDGPAATSWLWPDAQQEIGRATAHVVTWVSGAGPPVDAYRHLTRVVTAVLRSTDALGVYWGAAGQVIRADVFDGIAREHDDDSLPVMLWVDFRAVVEDSGSSLFTVGLSAFGLMELEIPPSSRQVGELRELAMNVATYLIQSGPVLGDGHTVGVREDERVVVRHAPSMVDRPGTVYRLEGY